MAPGRARREGLTIDGPDALTSSPVQDEVDAFWADARVRASLNRLPIYLGPTALESLQPPAWAFGATPEQADALLALVLDGTKTATSGALWDYDAAGEQLPKVGDLAILLDGAAHPRALIAMTDVQVVPFEEVTADVARAEGEGDGTLEHWRDVHEAFFTEHADHDRGFSPAMPVVVEHFRVLYQR